MIIMCFFQLQISFEMIIRHIECLAFTALVDIWVNTLLSQIQQCLLTHHTKPTNKAQDSVHRGGAYKGQHANRQGNTTVCTIEQCHQLKGQARELNVSDLFNRDRARGIKTHQIDHEEHSMLQPCFDKVVKSDKWDKIEDLSCVKQQPIHEFVKTLNKRENDILINRTGFTANNDGEGNCTPSYGEWTNQSTAEKSKFKPKLLCTNLTPSASHSSAFPNNAVTTSRRHSCTSEKATARHCYSTNVRKNTSLLWTCVCLVLLSSSVCVLEASPVSQKQQQLGPQSALSRHKRQQNDPIETVVSFYHH